MDKVDDLAQLVLNGAYPRRVRDLEKADAIIRTFIIGSYAPETPPISSHDNIACIGSCFATEMSNSLIAQGKPVTPLLLSERWNTAFAVRYFVERAFDNKPFPEGFDAGHIQVHDDALQKLSGCTAFIITLGLSVCWYELTTGRMIMEIKGGYTAKHMADSLMSHTMRQTTVGENIEQIEHIIATIRRARPSAPIIFTLSPVPLMASMTAYPPIASNTISKATLRVALHDVIDRGLDNVYYWPSYEIVEWIGKYIRPLWGQDGNDLRHLQSGVIDDIMRAFSKYYFRA